MLNGIVYFIEIHYKLSHKYINKMQNLYSYIFFSFMISFTRIISVAQFTPFINLRVKD